MGHKTKVEEDFRQQKAAWPWSTSPSTDISDDEKLNLKPFSTFTLSYELDIRHHDRRWQNKKSRYDRSRRHDRYPRLLTLIMIVPCLALNFWHQSTRGTRSPLTIAAIVLSTSLKRTMMKCRPRFEKCAKRLPPKWTNRNPAERTRSRS